MADSFTALYVAYSVVWAGVFAYLLYLYVRQRSIDRDLKSLKEELHGRAR
jgi:CcmD family protein